jgi:HNH endonuclease
MSVSNRQRFKILARDGFACRYCGGRAPDVKLEVDHVNPRSHGGSDLDSNLVAACFACNRSKAALVLRDLPQPGGFVEWLHAQRLRDDLVGDFADDVALEPTLHDVRTYRNLSHQLRAHGVERYVHRAAWHAWREFRRGGKPTRVIRQMQEETVRQIKRTTTFPCSFRVKAGLWMDGKLFKGTKSKTARRSAISSP